MRSMKEAMLCGKLRGASGILEKLKNPPNRNRQKLFFRAKPTHAIGNGIPPRTNSMSERSDANTQLLAYYSPNSGQKASKTTTNPTPTIKRLRTA